MKTILTIFFLIIPVLCFAGQKVFYDLATGRVIIDLSGKKMTKDIIEEFHTSENLNSIDLKDGENYRIENETLTIYNIENENNELTIIKNNKKKQKENKIKQKLGLNDEELNDLKESLRD